MLSCSIHYDVCLTFQFLTFLFNVSKLYYVKGKAVKDTLYLAKLSNYWTVCKVFEDISFILMT